MEFNDVLLNDNLPPIEDIFSSRGRIKVLMILAKEGELNISEIAKRANLNHGSCSNHLKFLANENILQEKVFGRIRIYRFRIENVKIRALKNLFDLWESSRF
ncbi:MAG: winged helix-turn-helix transcriptional regulator [Candidatus Helarchaeota archaeon]|nr:winged helix-turn-helix transcriptional regulator [Candidatus Helarchaeota archaeon]